MQPIKPKRIPICGFPPHTTIYECGNCGEPIKMNDNDEGKIKSCDKCGCPIDWND